MAKKNISARLPGLVSSNTVRRVTRSTLKLEVHESSTSRMSMSNKSGHKKKVKFENLSTVEGNSYKNVSLASDEGIDMNFSPSMASLSIPSTIIKPQHPLAHSWSFWYSAGDKKLSWKQNQVKISTVATIEEFWHTYNQVHWYSQPAAFMLVTPTQCSELGLFLTGRTSITRMEGGGWWGVPRLRGRRSWTAGGWRSSSC